MDGDARNKVAFHGCYILRDQRRRIEMEYDMGFKLWVDPVL
jgi:hypothetical protein